MERRLNGRRKPSPSPNAKWELVSPPAPTCPGSNRVTGEGGRHSRAGRACPVEASFDGGPFGFRPRSCDLGRFPTNSCQANLPIIRLRFLRPKPPVPQGLRRKWDRLAPHASSSMVLPSRRLPAIRRSPTASAVAAFPNFPSLRSVRSSSRKSTMTQPSESRQAESGPFCLWITWITWISRRIRAPSC